MTPERFARYYKIDGKGCWLWQFSRTTRGYAKVGYKGRTREGHSVSYEIFKGEIPKNLEIRHICDVRICVNPEHLILGTGLDNMADAKARGRPIGRKPIRDFQTLLGIFNFRAAGLAQKDIAKIYKTSQGYIGLVLQGKIQPKVYEIWHNPLQVRGDI